MFSILRDLVITLVLLCTLFIVMIAGNNYRSKTESLSDKTPSVDHEKHMVDKVSEGLTKKSNTTKK